MSKQSQRHRCSMAELVSRHGELEPERDRLWSVIAGLTAALDDVIVEARSAELASDLGVVVAAVEMEGVDLVEPAVGGDGLDSWFEEADALRFAPSIAQPSGMP